MTEQDGGAAPSQAGGARENERREGDAAARPPKAPPLPPHPLYEKEADEVAWPGRYPVQRVRYRYRRRDGSLSGPVTWELMRRGDATAILPWDPVTDRVALIEQFRLPALAAGEEPRMTEIPAGLLDPGEDPDGTARRELLEETGLEVRRMETIGSFLLVQGASDERVHFRLAEVSLDEGPGLVGGLAEENEETAVTVVTAEEAFAMVAENRIRNASAAIALLWLQVNHARLRERWTR